MPSAAKLAEDMAELRAKRTELKEKCAAVNAAKSDIDTLQKQVEGMQVSAAAVRTEGCCCRRAPSPPCCPLRH